MDKRTVSNWKREAKTAGDDWDYHRSAVAMRGAGMDHIGADAFHRFLVVQARVYQKIESLEAEKASIAIGRVSDAYNKMTKGTERLNPKLSELAVASRFIKELGNFIREHYPQHLPVFTEILEPFGVHLAKKFKP